MTLLFEFGRPLPAAEMRLKCCGTQVLDGKGVYCSAHNAAVPSGIRDSESVGPGQTRIRPNTAAGQKRRRLSWHPETAGVVAESAPEASPALSSSLAAPGTLSSLSSSPPAPASPSLPALAPSPSSMLPSPPSAAASARAPAVQPVTIPRTNQVEDVHARHVKVHERIVGQIF
jgi:hypothetical protein